MVEITVKTIGILKTPYTEPTATPIQSFGSKGRGTITVFPEFQDCLNQIEGFSHLILLTNFHKAQKEMLTETPMVDGGQSHGIFATRHMCRPNKIGFTVVKLIAVADNRLLVEGIDLLDETPVIDIKPYIPAFDSVPEASSGWLAEEHIENIRKKSSSLS